MMRENFEKHYWIKFMYTLFILLLNMAQLKINIFNILFCVII